MDSYGEECLFYLLLLLVLVVVVVVVVVLVNWSANYGTD